MSKKTETRKSRAKISDSQVLAARKMFIKNPEMSANAIRQELDLPICAVMVGRLLRGITFSHLDMCGLPIRPFAHTDAIKRRLARKEERKAARTNKKSNKAPSFSYNLKVNDKGKAEFTQEQIAKVIELAKAGKKQQEIAALFSPKQDRRVIGKLLQNPSAPKTKRVKQMSAAAEPVSAVVSEPVYEPIEEVA